MARRNLHLYLYTGLALLVLYFGLMLLVPVRGFRLPYESLGAQIPLIALFLAVVVVAPLLEEYAFRSWQRKGPGRAYVAPVLFILVAFGNGFLLPAILAAVVTVVYWIYYQRISADVIIIGTSIVFALAHIPEDYTHPAFYIVLSAYLGLALIFSYLRNRYHLGIAMLAHAGWNAFAVFAATGDTLRWKPVQEQYVVEDDSLLLERLSILSSGGSESGVSPDHISIRNASQEDLIALLLDNDPDIITSFETDALNTYSLKVTAGPDNSISKQAVLEKILDVFRLEVDSSRKELAGWELSLNPDKIPNDSLKRGYGIAHYTGRFDYFTLMLQREFETPVTTRDTQKVSINYSLTSTLKQQLEALQQNYAIQYRPVTKKVLELKFRPK